MQNVTGDHNVGMCSSNVTNKSLLVKNLLSI
jgi:hypothetical protein